MDGEAGYLRWPELSCGTLKPPVTEENGKGLTGLVCPEILLLLASLFRTGSVTAETRKKGGITAGSETLVTFLTQDRLKLVRGVVEDPRDGRGTQPPPSLRVSTCVSTVRRDQSGVSGQS